VTVVYQQWLRKAIEFSAIIAGIVRDFNDGTGRMARIM
jgi:hypothetical protein